MTTRCFAAIVTIALVASSPLPSRAEGSPLGTWSAFFARVFPLAEDDFTSVKGSVKPYVQDWFESTLTVDPAFARDCRIERFQTTWSLDCALTAYTDPVAAARDAIAAAGPGFKGRNISLTPQTYHYWLLRYDDYDDISIERAIDGAVRISVAQEVHVRKSPPDPLPTVPIVEDIGTNGKASYQVIATGLVVDSESGSSRVLAVIEDGRMHGPFEIGSHVAPARWQYRSATVLARDVQTGLILLGSTKLANARATFTVPADGGNAARLAGFGPCFIEGHDDFMCDDAIAGIRIGATRSGGERIEYQGGESVGRGSGVLIDDRGDVVGLTGLPLPNSPAHIALGTPLLRAFLTKSNVGTTLHPVLSTEAPADVAALLRSVVRISTATQNGTGVIVRSDDASSIVLTARHVVASVRYAYVFGANGEKVAASVLLDPNESDDLAILRVPANLGPATSIAETVRRGMHVVVIGYPRSAYEDGRPQTPTLTAGAIGYVDPDRFVVEYTAPTDHGNSGGAVFDPVTRSVAAIVRGEVGLGGFYGVDNLTIRRFLQTVDAR